MTIKTYTTQIEEVQAAITAILSGAQSHSIGGRSMTKADLAVLYMMQKELMPLALKESAGRTGSRVRYVEIG
jgi:hypothetical protein